jgi:hypothetical protein
VAVPGEFDEAEPVLRHAEEQVATSGRPQIVQMGLRSRLLRN